MPETMLLNEAAQYLGKKPQVLRRLVYAGILAASHGKNNALLFERKELDRVKALRYPEGMTHTQIAAHYGKKRGSVIYHFQRLRVKPLDAGSSSMVYDERVVSKFAAVLGWSAATPADQPGENHPGESSVHAPADGATPERS